jgi:hypothetical protein
MKQTTGNYAVNARSAARINSVAMEAVRSSGQWKDEPAKPERIWSCPAGVSKRIANLTLRRDTLELILEQRQLTEKEEKELEEIYAEISKLVPTC